MTRAMPGLQFRTLRSRIVVLVLAVLLLLQLASFAVIRSNIATNVRSVVGEELVLGQRVLRRLLEQNGASLRQGTEILSADFGFRAAVASQDRPTIASALHNHGARVGAEIMGIYDRDGALVSMVGAQADAKILWSDLPARLTVAGGQGGVDLMAFEGRMLQVVLLPVRAPVLIGWVIAGFDVGRTVAAELRQLTAIDVSFARGADALAGHVLASSIGESAGARIAQAAKQSAPGRDTPFEAGADAAAYASLWTSVAGVGEAPIYALMQRSISEAARPYDRLQFVLLVLTVVGVIASALASFATAHNIARPVRALADRARGLGAGELGGHIESTRRDELGELAGAFNTMSEQIQAREATIRRLAFEDALTGLPNRASVTLWLGERMAAGEGRGLSVLSLGLRRFKQINAVLGLGAGDRILADVAVRLDAVCSAQAVRLARIGGDAFVCLLDSADFEQTQAFAARLHEALRAPLVLESTAVDLSASIGIASWPEHGESPERLLTRAEIAMRAANRGHEDTRAFSDALDVGSAAGLSMASDLRRAIARDELILYYQPKAVIADGAVRAAEALVRWQHPSRGFIAPGEFIPFAESSGLVTEISAWALRQAIGQIAQWKRAGRELAVSVNLSTRDLLNQRLPEMVAELIDEFGIDAAQLCLEITESTIMTDADRALGTLDRLNGIGVKLSIDDFGTGYSSLAYLQRMPVDELKIDREFVRELDIADSAGTIVRSTIDLGHNLGLRVVAEGIETEAALARLREFGCDLAQGYLIAKPMDPQAFETWLDRREAASRVPVYLAPRASEPVC